MTVLEHPVPSASPGDSDWRTSGDTEVHQVKRGRIIAVCAAGVFALSATSAHAGEITGNGKDTPIRDGVASSSCAFSGLNDGEDPEFTGRTQNWGQIPKEFRDFLRSIGVSPGDSCRGNLDMTNG